MTANIFRSVPFSELSRNPAAVLTASEEGPLTITRQDGAPLTLLTTSAFNRTKEAMEAVAFLAVAALGDPNVPFVRRLQGAFPWLSSPHAG